MLKHRCLVALATVFVSAVPYTHLRMQLELPQLSEAQRDPFGLAYVSATTSVLRTSRCDRESRAHRRSGFASPRIPDHA